MSGRIGYAACVLSGFAAAYLAKRRDERVHGGVDPAKRRPLAAAALFGAIVGSKIGMLLFVGSREFVAMLGSADAVGDGKTIVGAIAGGFVAVEIAKRVLGIRERTGDVYAVALPLGAGIGRFGCLFAGCCYGAPTDSPLSIASHGAMRHPAPLYEALLLLAIAFVQMRAEGIALPSGHRFRLTLVAMAAARFVVEAVRGDPHRSLGPLSAVQWVCLAVIVGFSVTLVRELRGPASAG